MNTILLGYLNVYFYFGYIKCHGSLKNPQILETTVEDIRGSGRPPRRYEHMREGNGLWQLQQQEQQKKTAATATREATREACRSSLVSVESLSGNLD